MSHAKKIVETTRSYLGLGVEVGKAALQAVYVPTEKLTEERFANWIGDALVGQSIQYHEGFLLLDRSESGSGLGTKERNRLHSVARRAWIACELGLVHEAVEPEQLDAKVQEIVDALIQGGPLSQAAAKDLIRAVDNKPIDDAVVEDTAQRIAQLRATPEAQDGLSAFLDKRQPQWLA